MLQDHENRAQRPSRAAPAAGKEPSKTVVSGDSQVTAGPTRPRILLLFPAAARKGRLGQIERNECPADFLYGSLGPVRNDFEIVIGDSRKEPPGQVRRLLLLGERLRNRLINFGLTRQRVMALGNEIASADAAVSFTDAFSISLGHYRHALKGDARLVGGFHGLSDIASEVKPPFRRFVHRHIREGIAGLDHLFFFGDADRRQAIRVYGIPEEKTSLFQFGTDTDFWCPDDSVEAENLVLAVGSDPKRDYRTLLAAPIRAPIRIVTRLPVRAPADRRNIEIIRGSYHGSPISDLVLRELYRSAAVVAVPLRDVFQPSGYSVTLQAMACGKPVVLSRNKGLWDPDVFVSGENCLLVEPGNPVAMGAALERLHLDRALRRRIGLAARETAIAHFGLERMNRSLKQLIERTEEDGARQDEPAR